MPLTLELEINGRKQQVSAEPHHTLQQALHSGLGLTGAKHMCGHGACGSCTVIVDGRPVLSCITLACMCEGKAIQTVEGIAADPAWKPLIDAYCKWDAMQCGYCTPGFLVTAKALLDREPSPGLDECREALAGNICICGTYPRHAEAILKAAVEIAVAGKSAAAGMSATAGMSAADGMSATARMSATVGMSAADGMSAAGKGGQNA